jgi:hypothetical protein
MHQRKGNKSTIPANYLPGDENGLGLDDENLEGE